MTKILEVSEVARRLERSAQTVRSWADTGKLAAIRTERGARLFNLRDVEKFEEELRRKQQK